MLVSYPDDLVKIFRTTKLRHKVTITPYQCLISMGARFEAIWELKNVLDKEISLLTYRGQIKPNGDPIQFGR